jgi:hypothetical protein
MAYRAMIMACARAVGRPAFVVPMPLAAMAALAASAARVGIKLPLNAAELRRAGEDKRFDIGPMVDRLDIQPISFEAGLARMLDRPAT